MVDALANTKKIEAKLVLLLKKLQNIITEYPHYYNDLKPLCELTEIHANNIITIYTLISEEQNDKLKSEKTLKEKNFKDFLLSANEFCVESNILLDKHF